MDCLIFLGIGIVVGWHVPQPGWAVRVSAWVRNKFRKDAQEDSTTE